MYSFGRGRDSRGDRLGKLGRVRGRSNNNFLGFASPTFLWKVQLKLIKVNFGKLRDFKQVSFYQRSLIMVQKKLSE